jgi:signal transduction histidine kinase
MTRVLVADDERSIRLTLREFLQEAGYEVETAEDVPEARQKLQAGAFDYLCKPVPKDAVLRCVANAVRLKTVNDERDRLHRQLAEQNVHLEELVRLRTQQLADANARLALLDKAKSDFLVLISHELRTPMGGLFGVADLLITACPPTPQNQELVALFHQSRRQLLALLEDALLLTQIETTGDTFAQMTTPLGPPLKLALEKTALLAQDRQVRLEPAPHAPHLVRGEPQLLAKALQDLLDAAVRLSHPAETVRIALQPDDSEVVLRIDARHRTLPPDALPRFFQVLSLGQPVTAGGDLGLGPPVAQRIISMFGGGVAVENLDPPGIRLTVRLKTPSPGGC